MAQVQDSGRECAGARVLGRNLTLLALFVASLVVPAASGLFVWTERQPAGDTDQRWFLATMSADGTTCLAGAFSGRLYTSADGGVNWTERQPAGAGDLNWMCGTVSSDGAKIVAAAFGGRLYTSADSGASWTERQPAGASDQSWSAIAGSADGATLIAGVQFGRLYTSSDSGATWTERQPAGASNKYWAGVAVSADGTTMLAGVRGGRLYRSTDSGANWSEIQPAGNTDLSWQPVTCSSDGSKMSAGIYNGRLYTSTDGGSNWTERQPLGAYDVYWYASAGSADGATLLVTRRTYCPQASTDSGVSWASLTALGDGDWFDAHVSGDGSKAIAAADYGRLYVATTVSAPTVTTTSITNIGTGSADSGGNVTSDGGASVTARGVCWSTSANPTTSDSKTTDGTGAGGFTSNITGLDPDTTYHVRAYATNAAGTSYGSDVSFITSIAVTAGSGSASYIVGGSAAVVAPSLTVVAGNVTDFKVSITSNFNSGDALDIDVSALPGGVSGVYDAGTGVMTFTGTASAADWQALLRTVEFSTSSGNMSTRTIAFTAGGALPFDGNGHFYEYVAGSTDWTNAKSDAESRTLFGLQGYLATITSQAENDFIRQKLGADAWIAGSDASVEGEWRWASGPEDGTLFSNGASPALGQFANWTPGEPNNSSGNEHSAQIYSSGGGMWNDLPTTFALAGYVAEYGGMPGDGPSQITDTRDVIVSALPTVTTLSITSITAAGALTGGDVTSDGGATVTARGVCWSTSANPTTLDDKTADGTGTGAFASSITGLSTGTKYYVRAYATNSVGTAYGSELSFTTDSVPTVTTVAASNVTGGTADAGGNVTDDGGDPVSARGVCWSTSANPTTADDKTSDGTGSGAFVSSITGLSPGTAYHFRAYATNSAGTGYGADLTFTTPAPPTVVTKAVADITASSATVGGNVTSDGGDTVTARGVCWSMSANPTVADSILAGGTGTGSFTGTLTGLSAGTTYYVRAYATNAVGTGYGSEVAFNSSAKAPTVVTGDITSVGSTAAAGGGEVTDEGGATVTSRGLCWSTSVWPTVSHFKTEDGSGLGSFTSQISELNPDVTYYVRAYAINSADVGYGDVVSFTTDRDAPTVTTADVTGVTDSTAVCGGNVVADGGADVVARGVCWNATGSPTPEDASTADGAGMGRFTSEITGLDPNTAYYVRAYALSAIGASYGAERTFTTSSPPESSNDGNDGQVAPDLRIEITAPEQPANVGDELGFMVDVRNLGNGDATGVVLRFPLPSGTVFVGAWLIGGEAAQVAPLGAYVDGDEIVIELTDMLPEDAVELEIVLKATEAGSVTLEASVASEEEPTPVTAKEEAAAEVETEYLEIVNTVTPIGACGMFGLFSPTMLLLGMLAIKRRR